MEQVFSIFPVALPLIVACLGGLAMVRFNAPPIIGYILAGALLGPSGFALIADRESVALLAEMGVILLLFFLGAELSLRVFRRVWMLAVVVTVAEIVGSLGVVWLGGTIAGLTAQEVLLLGFCLALSSTAVVFSELRQLGQARSRVARISVAILLAQDLALAPMIVILQETGAESGGDFIGLVWKVGVTMGLLVAFIVFFSRRRAVSIPFMNRLANRNDVTPLIGLTLCVGAAGIAEIVGLTPAFGAFLAGLFVGNSRHRAMLMDSTQPLQATLLVLFFVSVGLLVDIQFIFFNFVSVILLWVVVVVFKTGLNVLALRMQGIHWPEAVTVSFLLAQIGEFAFVLVGAVPDSGDNYLFQLIVSVTLLTLLSTPFFASEARQIERLLDRSIGFRRVLYIFLAHSRDRVRKLFVFPAIWLLKCVFRLARSPARRRLHATETRAGTQAETQAALPDEPATPAPGQAGRQVGRQVGRQNKRASHPAPSREGGT